MFRANGRTTRLVENFDAQIMNYPVIGVSVVHLGRRFVVKNVVTLR